MILIGLILGHKFAIFDVPYGDKAAVIAGDDGVEPVIVASERDGMLVTCLDLILRLEWPKLNHDRTDNDVVGDWIVIQCRQDVLRAVRHPVNNVLDAFVALGVPNLHYFVSAETNQMVSLFIDIKVADRSVVTV